MTTPTDRAIEALRELIALGDLFDKVRAGYGATHTTVEPMLELMAHPDTIYRRLPAAMSEARSALAAVDAEPKRQAETKTCQQCYDEGVRHGKEQSAEPVTLADVLDALNVFNKPRPSEGGEPWTEADFISVKYLPDFINTIAAAWFSHAGAGA